MPHTDLLLACWLVNIRKVTEMLLFACQVVQLTGTGGCAGAKIAGHLECVLLHMCLPS